MDQVIELIIGLIMIIAGSIPLLDRSDRNQKGLSNAMYKGSGIALIIYGIIHFFTTIF